MSDEAAPGQPPYPSPRAPRMAKLGGLIAALGVMTVAAAVVGNDRPVLAALPVLLAAAAFALWWMPIRWSAAGLVFLTLALDTSNDAIALHEMRAVRIWSSPFSVLGDILRDNLERSFLPGVKLSGLEAAVIVMTAVSIYRRATHNPIDSRGQVQTATVLRDFMLVYLASLAFAVTNGLATGGSFLIWQVRPLLQIPILFFFFQAVFRGPPDHVLVGRVIVGAAVVKALMSLWVRYGVPLPPQSELHMTTNHGDSILYAVAVIILVANFTERNERRALGWALALVPLILLGMVANKRRLAWVELSLGLAAIYFLSPWRAWKRGITRLFLYVTPIIVLYVAVGWNRTGKLFGPVEVLRSLVDAKQDASTYWRDVENWNISMTMREHPVRGFGLGKEYREFIRNDDLTDVYAEWRYQPHNAILGLILFGGLLAFTGMWLLYSVAVYMGIRSYRVASRPEDRVAALCAIGAVLVCIVQAYGDIGPPFTQFRIFVALALAFTAKLAVATGAWPRRIRRAPPRLQSLPGPRSVTVR